MLGLTGEVHDPVTVRWCGIHGRPFLVHFTRVLRERCVRGGRQLRERAEGAANERRDSSLRSMVRVVPFVR